MFVIKAIFLLKRIDSQSIHNWNIKKKLYLENGIIKYI